MHLSYTFLAVLPSLLSCVPGSFALTAATSSKSTTTSTTTSCNAYITSTATFDNLPTDKPVKGGTANAVWYGLTVVNLTSFFGPNDNVALYPSSGSNVVSYGYQQYVGLESYYYGSSSGVTEPSRLQSFTFGCIVFGLEGYSPSQCKVTVLSSVPTYYEQQIQSKSYTYTRVDGKMQKAVPALVGTDYQIVVTGGSSAAQVYLDNVVVVYPNVTCTGE